MRSYDSYGTLKRAVPLHPVMDLDNSLLLLAAGLTLFRGHDPGIPRLSAALLYPYGPASYAQKLVDLRQLPILGCTHPLIVGAWLNGLCEIPILDWAATAPKRPHPIANSPRRRQPRLLIPASLFGGLAIRQILDECIVPALVEEFIRLKLTSSKSSEQSHNGDRS